MDLSKLFLKESVFPSQFGQLIAVGEKTGNLEEMIRFEEQDRLHIFTQNSAGAATSTVKPLFHFRDPAAWYHIVIGIDTTQSTDTDRFKFWVNGSRLTGFTTTSYISQNYTLRLNTAVEHEFGVRKGLTIKEIAKRISKRKCYGFDSFEGLPEDWSGQQYAKGAYSENGKTPKVPSNVFLEKGWFKDTLPNFLKNHKEKIDFIHFDADLYSSTKLILDLLGKRFHKGTILIFDEYFNYPNWKNHEYKAFQEFIRKEKISYTYLAFTSKSAVCLKIN